MLPSKLQTDLYSLAEVFCMVSSQSALNVKEINPQKFKIRQIVGERVEADFVTLQMWTAAFKEKQEELYSSKALQ